MNDLFMKTMKKTAGLFVSLVLSNGMIFSAKAADGELPLPDIDTSFKTYMDYRAITDTSSDQYKLQQKAYTDSDGIRRVGDDVCIAVGSAYADNVGDRLEITLDSGNAFTAVVGDFKADCDTDPEHMYYPVCTGMGDVTEFIADVSKLDKQVRVSGSVGSVEKYSGNIVSIISID